MLKLGLSIYQVSKLVRDKIPQRTVYAFLAGEKDTGTETASVIMNAIGLTMKPKSEKIRFRKGIAMKEKKSNSLRGRVKQEWEKAGKPKWTPRELLGICLLIDLEFSTEGLNPAEKFHTAIVNKDYNYLITWAQGLKLKEWDNKDACANKGENKMKKRNWRNWLVEDNLVALYIALHDYKDLHYELGEIEGIITHKGFPMRIQNYIAIKTNGEKGLSAALESPLFNQLYDIFKDFDQTNFAKLVNLILETKSDVNKN